MALDYQPNAPAAVVPSGVAALPTGAGNYATEAPAEAPVGSLVVASSGVAPDIGYDITDAPALAAALVKKGVLP